MPKIDISSQPLQSGTRYPAPYDAPVKERQWRRLGDAAGLTQFGVNLVTLKPGVWSSQRHWHALEDEFVMVQQGEVVLIDDGGETILRAGECAGFKAGDRNGHHFINRSAADAVLLVVGSRRDDDWGEYSDIDMKFGDDRYQPGGAYTRNDGTPF
jgi:uncharacterized cupin superfamily protein